MDDMKVKCKRCNRYAKASEFSLDPIYRIMVCPLCVKERKAGEQVHKEVAEMKKKKKQEEDALKSKPAGWDHDDELLERAHKMKSSVHVERIDRNRVNYICPKCKYKFVYDTAAKRPPRCPYCGSEISKFRF